MEPGECIGQVEAYKALVVGPLGERVAPTGWGLVGTGPSQVMGVEVSDEEGGDSFV